jgi:hypothetical protein
MTKPDNIVAYIGRSRSRVHEQMPLHLIHTNCPMTETLYCPHEGLRRIDKAFIQGMRLFRG